jgi:hypothetical protein
MNYQGNELTYGRAHLVGLCGGIFGEVVRLEGEGGEAVRTKH